MKKQDAKFKGRDPSEKPRKDAIFKGVPASAQAKADRKK